MAETKLKKQALVTESWIAPTLLNSWVNYGESFATAGYYKDALGIVHLKGLIKNGTIGQPCFQLPVGYRPSQTRIFSTVSATVIGDSYIGSDGNVGTNLGNNAWFSLEGISFLAEA